MKTSDTELRLDPAVVEEIYGEGAHELEPSPALELFDSLMTSDDPLGSLDEFANEAPSQQYGSVLMLLLSLKPETIEENFGEPVLYWAATRKKRSESRIMPLRDRLFELGYDLDLVEKSRVWVEDHHVFERAPGRDMLREYAFMSAILDCAIEDVDLRTALKEAAAPGVEISDKRASDYRVVPLRSGKNSKGGVGPVSRWPGSDDIADISYSMFLDTPVGFALLYKGKPQAIAGLVTNGQGEVMVHQVQGVKGSRVKLIEEGGEMTMEEQKVSARGLMPLQWRQLMFNVSAEVASNLGFESIAIQSAENNYWTDRPDPFDQWLVRYPLHKAKAHYDDVAKELGYELGKDGNWHKLLS